MGGQATLKRHGRNHFVQAGKAGFASTVARHWKGDRKAYLAFLKDKGLLIACDREFALMIDIYRELRPDLLEDH